MKIMDLSRDAIIAELHKWTPHAARVLLILIGALVLRLIVKAAIRRIVRVVEQKEGDQLQRIKTLTSVLRNAFEVGLWGVTATLILGEIGINLGPILAAAGVAGLAIGFGAQSLVKDMVNGFFFLFEDQVRVGDVVEVAGKSGLVEHITLRTLTIRDFAGNVHIIPHSEITTVTNRTMDFSRALIDVGVAYRENIEQVIQVLMEEAVALKDSGDFKEKVIGDPEVFGIDDFSDSAILLRVRFTTKPLTQWDVARAYRRRIKIRFDAENIEIPFPHQTVYFGEDKHGSAPPVRLLNSPPSQNPNNS